MPLFIISLLVQVALVIHVVKTGRNTIWIWIIVMLPLAGTLAYLIVEVLPSLSRGNAGRKMNAVINPNRDINAASRQYSISDTTENTKRLAEEYFAKGAYEEAKSHYQKCLSGPYSNDPNLMFGLAKSDYELGNFSDVKNTLDDLIAANPDFKNQDAHLLYARTLVSIGETSEALHEFEVLHQYYAGPEASFYYARCLASLDKELESQEILQQILDKAELSGTHYGKMHKDILKQVKKAMSEES